MTLGTSKTLFLTVLLAALLFLTACLDFPQSAQEGPISILGILEGQEMTEIVEARIVISRGKHTYEEVVPLRGKTFSAEMEIPIGQWELTVLLVDAEGKAHYQSAAESIEVDFNQNTICEVILGPANSTIAISIDLTNYVFRKEALRARIHFNDTVHELVREESDQPFELEIELAPGSYEFTVELYTESFRIGDRIGPGFWKIIDVQPDEELEITFYPATETLNITGWIELLLPAPTELHAEPLGSEVHLSWLALPQQNQGYFILAQTDPLNRFQVLNTRPVAEPNFTHNLGEEKFPMEIRYTVAAVSENGLVGYYAATKTVFLESD